MEDRSLCKIRLRGPRFDPSRGLLFRRELIRKRCLTENPTSDGFFQSRNLDSKAVATSLLGEEERSLENWSYDVICLTMWYDVILTYCATLQTTILQPVTITAQTCPPTAGQGVDWKQAKMIEGSSATTKAGSWKGTGRRIIGQGKKKKIIF